MTKPAEMLGYVQRLQRIGGGGKALGRFSKAGLGWDRIQMCPVQLSSCSGHAIVLESFSVENWEWQRSVRRLSVSSAA